MHARDGQGRAVIARALLCAMVFAAAAIGPAAAEDAFFAGKTLKIIVGMPPGGGVDAYARLVQRHMSRHLAGAPSIVVTLMFVRTHSPARKKFGIAVRESGRFDHSD